MNGLPTRYGHIVDFWNPTPAMIDIKDIAFSLSKICRFNGHGKSFYSIAQHSVIVAKPFTDPTEKLYALLHDCHEFVTGDITTPFKKYLESVHPGIIRTVEDKLDFAIHEQFGLHYPLPEDLKARIKVADKRALATEIRDLTKRYHRQALNVMESLPEPFEETIIALSPRQSHRLFFAALKDAQTQIPIRRVMAVKSPVRLRDVA